MDKKDLLYELSLKYNTLKMYENTINKMKDDDKIEKSTIEAVEKEKKLVEGEFINLLTTNNDVSDNKFLKVQKEKAKNRSYYDVHKNFFDEIVKKDGSESKKNSDNEKQVNKYTYNKPAFFDVQEKISNSKWINCFNFILEFPKKEIDIDAWRVSSFYYQTKQNLSCSQKHSSTSGELYISVNDFSEKQEDGTYKILSKIVNKLSMQSNAHVVGDICVKIIDNVGNLLYSMYFENCRFITYNSNGFSYEVSLLRKFNLTFEYDELHILSPDEKWIEKR